MDIYTLFERDLTELGSFLGNYSNPENAIDMVRTYSDCVHFKYKDNFITEPEIKQKMENGSFLLLETNNGAQFYIFKSVLDKTVQYHK